MPEIIINNGVFTHRHVTTRHRDGLVRFHPTVRYVERVERIEPSFARTYEPIDRRVTYYQRTHDDRLVRLPMGAPPYTRDAIWDGVRHVDVRELEWVPPRNPRREVIVETTRIH